MQNAFFVGLYNGLIRFLASLIEMVGFFILLANPNNWENFAKGFVDFFKEFWANLKKLFKSYLDKFTTAENTVDFIKIYVEEVAAIIIDVYLTYVSLGAGAARKVSEVLERLLKNPKTTVDDWKDYFKKRKKNDLPEKTLDVFDEVDELIIISKNFDDISEFRKKNNLPNYIDNVSETGTVAKFEINNLSFYGLNSKLASDSLALRKKWFNSIDDWVPPKKNIPSDISRAQSFLHAEAHALMNAFESIGSFGKKVVIYVDRKTCNMCVGELPILMKKMGIEELSIINDVNKAKKITIKIVNDEIQVHRH